MRACMTSQLRRTVLSFLLFAVVLSSSLRVHGGTGKSGSDESTESRYKHLQLLEVTDLKQVLHEKGEPFHHLRTKKELIEAVLQVEKREEAFSKARMSDTVQHEVRVEYCSG
uniref:Rho termination factor N-terminal domain-containing protein n=1 Tax=Trypanosoma congolense (strain IL3000) TaxID=1068625 RepID=G0UMF5_TRYCI|nr:conserved hypothetical protein [Trypanosoma congolense IL3000]